MSHRTSRGLAVLCACLAVTGCNSASEAPPREVTRSVLVKRALSNVPDKEGQIVLVQVPPKGATGKHTHPVDEFIYVLEGQGELHRPGEAVVGMKPGDSLVLSSGQVHEVRNLGTDASLKFLQFSVPAPGQPLLQPVP
jgi:quercetin dioxygenase-like cupin family protein